MTDFLLDTNVVSEVIKPRPSRNVLAFFDQAPIGSLFLSDIVIAEIRFGIESTGDAARRLCEPGRGRIRHEDTRPRSRGEISLRNEALIDLDRGGSRNAAFTRKLSR